jgi:GNAT superfamily N-acetyltransferase
MQSLLNIRPARPGEESLVLELIRELAVYERLEHAVEATPEMLAEALHGDDAVAECLLADWEGETVGFALFFRNFSTFVGRPGLYLEDLYVRPSHRGRGIGKALLLTLAGIARERGYGRMEWSVLDWNQSAIDFYRALGAEPMDDWTVFRLDHQALNALAG